MLEYSLVSEVGVHLNYLVFREPRQVTSYDDIKTWKNNIDINLWVTIYQQICSI